MRKQIPYGRYAFEHYNLQVEGNGQIAGKFGLGTELPKAKLHIRTNSNDEDVILNFAENDNL